MLLVNGHNVSGIGGGGSSLTLPTILVSGLEAGAANEGDTITASVLSPVSGVTYSFQWIMPNASTVDDPNLTLDFDALGLSTGQLLRVEMSDGTNVIASQAFLVGDELIYQIFWDSDGGIIFDDNVPSDADVEITVTSEPWASRGTWPVSISQDDLADGVHTVVLPLISGDSGLGDSPSFEGGLIMSTTQSPALAYTLRSDGTPVTGFVAVSKAVLDTYTITASEQGTDLTLDELAGGVLVHTSAAFTVPAAAGGWTAPSFLLQGEAQNADYDAANTNFPMTTPNFGVDGKLVLAVCKAANGSAYTFTSVSAGGKPATQMSASATPLTINQNNRANVEFWEVDVVATDKDFIVGVTNGLADTGVSVFAFFAPSAFDIHDFTIVNGPGTQTVDVSVDTPNGGTVIGAIQVQGGAGDLATLTGASVAGTRFVRSSGKVSLAFVADGTTAETPRSIIASNTTGQSSDRFAGIALAVKEPV